MRASIIAVCLCGAYYYASTDEFQAKVGRIQNEIHSAQAALYSLENFRFPLER